MTRQEFLSKARENARLVIQRAANAPRRKFGKIMADARKALTVPEIPPELSEHAESLTREIEDLYRGALVSVETAALLSKADQEQDDEEVLLLMT